MCPLVGLWTVSFSLVDNLSSIGFLPEQDTNRISVISKERFLLVECKLNLSLELYMLVIFLEALLAIVIVGAFIWWTMKGK